MVGDAEKADLATGRADAFGHGSALGKVGRKQPGDVDQRQRGGFEMAGAKGLVHGSILLCRRGMAVGERSIWRSCCAQKQRISSMLMPFRQRCPMPLKEAEGEPERCVARSRHCGISGSIH